MNNRQPHSFRPKPTRRVWLSAAACALLPVTGVVSTGGLLPAQAILGSLTGSVTDAKGAVVANASVKVTNKQTGDTRQTLTDAEGQYTVAGLPLGNYIVDVASSGFKVATLPDVPVALSSSATANVTLDIGGGQRITGRQFLVGDSKEETGYGLYSYMLFGRPPTVDSRERYLALLREYLALPETSELKKRVPTSQLNITCVPLSENAPSPNPDSVLKVYDFVLGQVLLSKIPGAPWVDGPYIVSYENPLTRASVLPKDSYLFQDLSSVPQEIVNVWVREFMLQSGQKDYWKKRKGPDAALKLRTAIAQLAAGVDPAKKSLREWQSILATLISWKPGISAPAK